jgi:hydrogenase maturation protein HypF
MAELSTAPAMDKQGARVHVDGIVQGVGFRPFVYGLATRLGLSGWVKNTSAGVDIAVEGREGSLTRFIESLQRHAPPLAQIHGVRVDPQPLTGFDAFEIIASQSIDTAFQPISPDVSICPDCLRELLDPGDRRYRYPFINCTNCGPRFTIIEDIPYDRPKTTMAGFDMCPDCRDEYEDPLDRRFHAQPVACPKCGPSVWLERTGDRVAEHDGAIEAARSLLAAGRILAVKGLGGFHLACDATDQAAVSELRRRKGRVDKPFAVMMPSIEIVEKNCIVSAQERALLLSRERPIVVLERRPDSALVTSIAPGQSTAGVMLPYTPLHALLLETAPGFPQALVMTSGNLSEEPIATDNDDARRRLAGLADAFLMHDRPIQTRCDDSVVRVQAQRPYPLRRSRGYAPSPINLPFELPSVLAVGAELKNTFCLTRDRYGFLSQHIGDLENFETLTAFENGVRHMERLFRIQPEVIGYDLHPDYLATRYARKRAEEEGLTAVGIQHHHAHIAAAMADAGLSGREPVIGVAFDGTGYGLDGAIWGGEFLLATYQAFERPLHLKYFPLAGGEVAIRNPWRLGLSLLHSLNLPWNEDSPAVRAASVEAVRLLKQQLTKRVNTVPTSSVGRLFDAVASLTGVRQQVNYEAQAAIELEMIADPAETCSYELTFGDDGSLDPSPMIADVLADLDRGVEPGQISTRFHRGLANAVAEGCRRIRAASGVEHVVLSGGVWQNMLLLELTVGALAESNFEIITHRRVPANDGGLALGQALIAGSWLDGIGSAVR